MNEFQVFDWSAIGARIRAKRVFLYWFIPVTFLCIWGFTFTIPTYYNCTTSLSTEEVYAAEMNRTMTLNRPEQYDLGLMPLAYSIVADDYDEVIRSSDFLCRILNTPVMTADSSFSGTYYAYLAIEHKYSWSQSVMRFLRGIRRHDADQPLPALDPFFPRGVAAEALGLARKNITCNVDRRTSLTTISVRAQDRLVAAQVAQAVSDNLKAFTSEYFLNKTEGVYAHLQEQITLTYTDYEFAKSQGDKEYAAMLYEAYRSFERQAIILNAQMRYYQIFTTLYNVSVPVVPAGPHHLLPAGLGTIVLALLALLVICRRELFGMNAQ